ncbi:hypothetical protein Btru_016797 [Bulinus truncatus]|nr:hypothetical protein Btru_016797 [Bulinus truncatus]
MGHFTLMGSYSYLVFLVLSLALWWIFQEIQIQKTFTVDLSSHDPLAIFDFFKNPHNLEKVHPKLRKVSNLQVNNELTSFDFEESYPFITLSFQMTIIEDVDALVLRYQTNSSIAEVTVELQIESLTKVQQQKKHIESIQPTATVNGRLVVKGSRIINHIICGHLVQIWQNILLASSDFIPLTNS